ncbi:MAG: 7-carboxy-7-deazaguanine synthase QueE [Alicyclobacillus sp. RIFOXYA1_FULL_53_8]|nr:MAG: 7-carboxy-7-deazaguanine synthase QueE [Alicyclobacillus sp. RIFOXYA1_FULL_53_8]
MAKIPVMEVFGPTIQGEGMVIGRKTMFVRTAGCDYQCLWCDSPFTWNGAEKDKTRWLEPAEIVSELRALGGNRFNHVTVSGGNPALIGQAMKEFIDLCHDEHWAVGLETQGSRKQTWFHDIDDLTLSPKPPSSGMKTDFSVLDDLVNDLMEHRVHFSLKIVIFDQLDLEYAKSVFQRYPGTQTYLQVGNDQIEHSGDLAQHLLQRLHWLFERAIEDPGFNDTRVLPQLHALIWGNERAR